MKRLNKLIKNIENNKKINLVDRKVIYDQLLLIKNEIAINYSQSCETLKDKKKLNFKDWKFSKGVRYLSGHTYKDNDGDLYDSDELERMYDHYLSL